MSRSLRQGGLTIPRGLRGLLAGAMLALVSTNMVGCLPALSYVYRNVSPFHPTGWSFAWPILPSQSQRLEEDMAREDTDRVPILDPVPGENAPLPCLDPPSEEEVWRKVPHFRPGWPALYEVQRNDVQFLIEKIGEKVDPVKVYPLAGPCQLVHCHYKCTVFFLESYWSDYPIPFNHRKDRIEVVYIDKDYLRRAAGPPVATIQ